MRVIKTTSNTYQIERYHKLYDGRIVFIIHKTSNLTNSYKGEAKTIANNIEEIEEREVINLIYEI